MKSRRTIAFIVAVFILVASTSVLFAQHTHAGTQDAPTDMMQQCQKNRSDMSALVEQISETLASAKEQSNPEEIRAAVEKAQSQLAEIKQHMSMCPMTKDGIMADSDGHMKSRKCMSKGQQSNTEMKSDDSAIRQ